MKKDLRKIDWINEILKNGNDVNEILDILYKTLSEIDDRHAPLRKVTKKERNFDSKPWISKEIKQPIILNIMRKSYACINETQKKLIHKKF